MVPRGSSNKTSMRESAVRELEEIFQPILGATQSPAALREPFCKNSRRFMVTPPMMSNPSSRLVNVYQEELRECSREATRLQFYRRAPQFGTFDGEAGTIST